MGLSDLNINGLSKETNLRWSTLALDNAERHILCAKKLKRAKEYGVAISHLVLAAEEEGIGSCILCNVNREKLREKLNIPVNLHVDSVIALGFKAEKSVVEDFKGSIEYWRDENEVLHVPKRKLEDILHINEY